MNEVQVRPERPERRLRGASATVGIIALDGGRRGRELGDDLRRSTAAASRSRRSSCRTGRRASTSSDASGGGQGAQVYRVDDASQPAATLTASNNAAWTRLSNPTPGTPGFAVYNYCNTPLVGSQCFYDMFIALAGRPARTWSSSAGSCTTRSSSRTRPRAACASNGRAVLMSMDAGAHVDGRDR